MAGTLRGKADCVNTAAHAGNNCQEIFKNWYDFMEYLAGFGVVVRMALSYGSGGTGTDFYDGANPFGPGAFALYKWPANGGRSAELYQLGIWTNNTAMPGLMKIRGASSWTGGAVGFSWASAFEAGNITPANPWQQSMNNDGTDTISTYPVWEAPVGGSMTIWPVSNQIGYSHGSNRENTLAMFTPYSSANTANSRYTFWADNDTFMWYLDYGDVLNTEWGFVGRYTPRPNMINNPYHLAALTNSGALLATATYGTTAGNNIKEGGAYNPRDLLVQGCRFTYNTGVMATTGQPSELVLPTEYEEHSIHVAFLNAGTSKGTLGAMEHMRAMYGVVDQDYAADLSRIVVGSSTIVAANVSLPWNGAYTPRSTSLRGGTTF